MQFMPSVIYAECRYDVRHYAECRYAECRGAQWFVSWPQIMTIFS